VATLDGLKTKDWDLARGVNFINVLRAAFTRPDAKCTKQTYGFTVFFALFGSACVKAA